MLRSTSGSFLVRRAVKIAQKKHGHQIETPIKQASLLPAASVSDLSDAIKFVSSFSERKTLRSTSQMKLPSVVSTSLCNILPRLSPLGHSLAQSPNSSRLTEHTFDGRRQRKQIEELRSVGLCVSDLTDLVEMSKERGEKPSKGVYTELLKLCFSLISIPEQNGVGTKLPPAVVKLVHHMTQDCGKEEVKAAIYSCALQVSTSPAQVDSIYKQFEGTNLESKLGKELIIEAYLQTEATPRPSLTRLLSQVETPSPLTFERLILACTHKYQLSRCVGVYTCMTRRYKMAPSKKVFKAVTQLLSETFEADQTQMWKLGLTSQLLADTLRVFHGHPPLWVYPEMAKPLALILGTDGYAQMLEASGMAAQEYCSKHGSEAKIQDTMRSLWTPPLFRSLLKCAQWTQNTSLALDLLSDMKLLYHASPPSWSDVRQGHRVRWSATFKLLLDVISSPEHLTSYLPGLMEEMTEILSPEEMNSLRVPLTRALERAYTSKSLSSPMCLKPHLRSQWHVPLSPVPGYLSAAAHLLIDTAMQATSNDKCISDLTHLAGGHSETARTSCDLNSMLAI